MGDNFFYLQVQVFFGPFYSLNVDTYLPMLRPDLQPSYVPRMISAPARIHLRKQLILLVLVRGLSNMLSSLRTR